MKRLTLVRHAKAEPVDPRVDDFARPLDRRGVAEIRHTGERLLSQQLIPDLIVTSTAVRAMQSAEIVLRALAMPARLLKRDERLYLASPGELLAVIHETGPRVGHLLVVGHNPGLTELVRKLASSPAHEELATASIATMQFEARSWARIGARAAHGLSYEAPKRFLAPWA